MIQLRDYGTLTGYPERLDPRELEVGDVVLMVTQNHIVMDIVRYPVEERRWTVRVTWEDGQTTFYTERSRVQRSAKVADLREGATVCIVEASATPIP
jgi:hypothetical protein